MSVAGPVVLASGSPRRRLLLGLFLDDFQVEAADVDESVGEEVAVETAVREVAARKATAVSRERPGAIVLGADTALESDGVGLGKPEDEAHLRIMLHALQDRTHTVWTGIAVAQGGQVVAQDAVASKVTLRPLPPELLDAYAGSDAWRGKAGGYGIQDPYLRAFLRLEGSWTNVVGLPLRETAELLRDAGADVGPVPEDAAVARDNPF